MIFNKKKPENVGNPAWLKWMVAALLLYMGYQQLTLNKAADKVEDNSSTSPVRSAKEDTTPEIIPNLPGMKFVGDITGTGGVATCGQKANVRVQAILPSGSSAKLPTGGQEVVVGMPDKSRDWLPAISGMRVGGVREVILPAGSMLTVKEISEYNIVTGTQLNFRLFLDELSPSVEAADFMPLTHDTKQGNGAAITCGQSVKVNFVIWGEDGKRLYSSNTDFSDGVDLKVGASQLFFGLDWGLLGMRPGGSRTLILPPSYLEGNDLPDNNKMEKIRALIPAEKTLAVDVNLLSLSAPTNTTK